METHNYYFTKEMLIAYLVTEQESYFYGHFFKRRKFELKCDGTIFFSLCVKVKKLLGYHISTFLFIHCI